MFLTYLPEFRAKLESAVRPLPHSFSVDSLRDFVGDLPEKLLLCLYLFRMASLPLRPRTCFVSPRAPSRPLSKDVLSFFIRDVIAEAYPSAGLSLPPVSLPSSSSSRPRSSHCEHGVHGVATSWAFQRNAPLASILEAASWSSASIFTSFYLSDVHFSSSRGFILGPVVAAGSVV